MAPESTPPSAPTGAAIPVTDRNLFLISVLGLFLELLVIRWICTEIQVFSYLQNTVLVTCFLGLGMGCWTCRRPFTARDLLLPLLVLALLLAIPFTRGALQSVSVLLHFFGSSLQWQETFATRPAHAVLSIIIGLALMFLVLIFVWDVFVPIGRLLGRLMDDHPRTIRAYSVNIAGSLIGIWLFVLLSAWHQPPLAWLAVVGILVLLLFGLSHQLQRLDAGLLAAVLACGAVAGWTKDAYEVWWSPYQKLTLVDPDQKKEDWNQWLGIGKYIILVGPGPYQGMLDLSPENVAKDPERYPPDMAGLSQYDLPPRMHPHPRKALIVGAGSGNDAAGLLRQGIDDVTAVDIDPTIISLGKRYHPEKPYDDPRVHIVNDDARSFFATTPDRYDLIVFGLLDAHTSTAMTNARLDHYVYTRESLRGARALLAEGGVLVLTFEVLQPFIPERIFEELTTVFGQEPVYFRIPATQYGWGGVMFVASDNMETVRRQIDRDANLSRHVAAWHAWFPIKPSGRLPEVTDDWPYLYLERPSIPPLYFMFIVVLLALFWRGMRKIDMPGVWATWSRPHWHFLFLGAAFMLLEVQNISKASVVLGNTWQVNAVIISGILTLILLANLIAAWFPRLPLGPVYVLLCGSCLALYGVDLARFAFLPYPAKAAVVGVLTSLPMLFSGIIFIRSFVAVPHKDAVLGANLLGALLGGLLQTLTFLTGIKALLLIVAGLYFIAFLTRPTATIAQPEKTFEPAIPEPVS